MNNFMATYFENLDKLNKYLQAKTYGKGNNIRTSVYWYVP